MAVQRRLNCSPEQVFAVLRDGWTYPVWVVGASRMRSVDEGWPAPGTKLHHSFGVWPLLIDDTTEVLEIESGSAGLSWRLEAGRSATLAWRSPSRQLPTVPSSRSQRTSSDGPARLVPQPVRVAGIDVRNRETLRRLAYLAEGRDDGRCARWSAAPSPRRVGATTYVCQRCVPSNA